MNIVLISTYALGHQPFGLASPIAWLNELELNLNISCFDTSLEKIDAGIIRKADLIAYYIPMHTATKVAAIINEKIREINPGAHICFYGLYAPVNETYLRKIGGHTVLGGEFEEGLTSLVKHLAEINNKEVPYQQFAPVISLAKQSFKVPDRRGLSGLNKYAYLSYQNSKKVVGYTEASRGCKHICTHCPVVPVYEGQFRIVQKDIVIKDIENQVNMGAQHISFGDPDFFNGPGHAIKIVSELHEKFPEITYDVIIKIEHIIRHSEHLPLLKSTGCILITSAVESFDETVLLHLKKGHTKNDFLLANKLIKNADIAFQPTFVAFTPWTTLEEYHIFLKTIYDLDLLENVPSIQFGIRLLIPSGSKLLLDTFIKGLIEEFDESSLFYPWKHPDPFVDKMQQEIIGIIEKGEKKDRKTIFFEIWEVSNKYFRNDSKIDLEQNLSPPGTIPVLSEAWYCCAEPAQHQVEKNFI